jgi:hypothetical protein
LLEFGVVSNAALEGDGLVRRSAGRLTRRVSPGALAVLERFRDPIQRRGLVKSGDVPAVPLNPEPEVLVSIETGVIDPGLGHGRSSFVFCSTHRASC